MSVAEICNREVVIADKHMTIVMAAQLMREHHVGSLVVVDEKAGDQKPLGIVTDRDLVIEVLAKNAPMEELVVGDVMGPELLTARESDGIWETIMRMRAMGVRRLPVVDPQGVLAGIISMDDLLQFLAGELADLVKLVRREQKREEVTRPVP